MADACILEQLGRKGANVAGIVDRIIEKPEAIAELVEALKGEKRAVKFSYEKVLRLVSERRPELVYPYFDVFFEQVDDKAAVVAFVRRQLKNTRKPVVKKAERFLRKHGI